MNTYSNPSELKITDMRFVDIDGAPKRLLRCRYLQPRPFGPFGSRYGFGDPKGAAFHFYSEDPRKFTDAVPHSRVLEFNREYELSDILMEV